MASLTGDYLALPGLIVNLATKEIINVAPNSEIVCGATQYAEIFNETIEIRSFDPSGKTSKIPRIDGLTYSFTSDKFVGISNKTGEINVFSADEVNTVKLPYETIFVIASRSIISAYTSCGHYVEYDLVSNSERLKTVCPFDDALVSAAKNSFDFPPGYYYKIAGRRIDMICDDWSASFTRSFGTIGRVLVNTKYIVLESTNYTFTASKLMKQLPDITALDGQYMCIEI